MLSYTYILYAGIFMRIFTWKQQNEFNELSLCEKLNFSPLCPKINQSNAFFFFPDHNRKSQLT